MPATEPAPTLEAFGATYLRLTQLRRDVGDAEWRKGATPRAADDTTQRMSGTVSDPTPTITLDPRRIELRAAMIESQEALAYGEAAMRHAIATLEAVQGS